MISKFTLAVVLLSVVGCTSAPQFDDEEAESLSELSMMVKCQALTAFQTLPQPSPFDLTNWYVTFSITKQTKESAALGVDPFDWILPTNLDKLVLHGNASLGRVSTRNAKVEYTEKLNTPYADFCPGSNGKKLSIQPVDFKVGAWARQLSATNTTPDSFGYTVDVVVTVGGGLNAELAKRRLSGTTGFNGERETTRTIDFAFSQAPDPRGSKVYVTNMPIGGIAPSGGKPKNASILRSVPQRSGIPAEVIQQNRQILQQLQIDRIDRSR
ncbi:hypothetical protein [Rhizobium leguminosarum]|uniref:hypothetical protein n=1 Tax=Rhizobium leguminosarum TaxID=384 RepID=UPI003F9785A2